MHVHGHFSPLTSIVARILAVLIWTLPLVPPRTASAQSVTPALACSGISVRLDGPSDGSKDTQYVFTANVRPTSGYLLQSIEWFVDHESSRTDTLNPSTQEFSWATGGVKTVTVKVTAEIDIGRRCVIDQRHAITISPMPVAEAPLDVHRLAAQLLEEQREVAPNWADASFFAPWGEATAGAVTPLYRPGIVGPAYYEFQVFGPTDPNTHRGYIIVSTGAHDYPIPNWSTGCYYREPGDCAFDYVGWSPTHRMRVESGWTADRFYKLDVLSYVGEDINTVPAGTPVASRGTLPPKVTWPAGWADNPPPLVTTNWVPAITEGIDQMEDRPPVPASEVVTPTVVIPDNMLTGWDVGEWGLFKSGYAANYQPLIQALALSAAPEWDALKTQNEYGYVLHKGESASFPLLFTVTSVTHEGDAYQQGLITVGDLAPGDPSSRLVYTAVEDVRNQGVPMTTTVSYEGGAKETIRVMVVSNPDDGVDLPPGVYLPLVTRGVSAGASAAVAGPAAAPSALAHESLGTQTYTPGTLAADGYTYWFVGGTRADADAQQAWYSQFDAGNCKSGCGPTAWAMLIAWGDMRAHEGTNGFWAGRTGLYRFDGGRGDASTVAPTTVDNGVEKMVKEIRDDVGTFCNPFNDSGATLPSDMDEVIQYLNGRTGVNVRTWYLPAGFSLTGSDGDTVRSVARNVIQNAGDSRRPTVIGTGWLSHYPLAYGYRQKTAQVCSTRYTLVNGKMTWVSNCWSYLLKGFYVNQGWGDGTGEWVNTDIWFTGRLTPQVAGANDVGVYRRSNSDWLFDMEHDGTLNGMFDDYNDDPLSIGGIPSAVRPVMGDFDRDGVLDDLGAYVFQSSIDSRLYDWYLDYDADGDLDRIVDRPITLPNAWPLVLDYDRDGFVDDLALYSPDTYSYGYMCYEAYCQGYATGGEYLLPVTGDFDRDGDHDDIAFSNATRRQWAFDLDHDNDFDGAAVSWPSGVGTAATPFAGDLDLDGVADDVGLYDPGTRTWYYDYNHNGSTDDSHTSTWSEFNDLPFAGALWQY